MDPTIWGPPAWFFLHTITLNYPNNPTKKDKINYKKFFYSLYHVIPCSFCKNNYSVHIKNIPIDNFLDSRTQLIKWLVYIHNATNQHLKKDIFTIKQFTNKYKNIYTKKNYINSFKYNIILFLLILFIFIILFILFYYNYISIPNLHFDFH